MTLKIRKVHLVLTFIQEDGARLYGVRPVPLEFAQYITVNAEGEAIVAADEEVILTRAFNHDFVVDIDKKIVSASRNIADLGVPEAAVIEQVQMIYGHLAGKFYVAGLVDIADIHSVFAHHQGHHRIHRDRGDAHQNQNHHSREQHGQ